jgi:hypothetical protein
VNKALAAKVINWEKNYNEERKRRLELERQVKPSTVNLSNQNKVNNYS